MASHEQLYERQHSPLRNRLADDARVISDMDRIAKLSDSPTHAGTKHILDPFSGLTSLLTASKPKKPDDAFSSLRQVERATSPRLDQLLLPSFFDFKSRRDSFGKVSPEGSSASSLFDSAVKKQLVSYNGLFNSKDTSRGEKNRISTFPSPAGEESPANVIYESSIPSEACSRSSLSSMSEVPLIDKDRDGRQLARVQAPKESHTDLAAAVKRLEAECSQLRGKTKGMEQLHISLTESEHSRAELQAALYQEDEHWKKRIGMLNSIAEGSLGVTQLLSQLRGFMSGLRSNSLLEVAYIDSKLSELQHIVKDEQENTRSLVQGLVSNTDDGFTRFYNGISGLLGNLNGLSEDIKALAETVHDRIDDDSGQKPQPLPEDDGTLLCLKELRSSVLSMIQGLENSNKLLRSEVNAIQSHFKVAFGDNGNLAKLIEQSAKGNPMHDRNMCADFAKDTLKYLHSLYSQNDMDTDFSCTDASTLDDTLKLWKKAASELHTAQMKRFEEKLTSMERERERMRNKLASQATTFYEQLQKEKAESANAIRKQDQIHQEESMRWSKEREVLQLKSAKLQDELATLQKQFLQRQSTEVYGNAEEAQGLATNSPNVCDASSSAISDVTKMIHMHLEENAGLNLTSAEGNGKADMPSPASPEVSSSESAAHHTTIIANVSRRNDDVVHNGMKLNNVNSEEAAIVSHGTKVYGKIGGSLAKIVYYTEHDDESGGRLIFKKIETERIDECFDFIASLLEDDRRKNGSNIEPVIKATGGGAHLFYEKLLQRLPGVSVQKEDEMDCLVTGLNFYISEIPYEVFTYSESDPMMFEETPTDIYPYMLVNIGSGVSILEVTGPDKFTRISGTSLGGGTYWGIASMLTGAQTFDEMLDIAQYGDNHNVDMLVGDIYGMDYNKIGLKSTAIASSFGKVFKKNVKAQGRFKNEDLSRSLLYMISNNIGQIAYLNAQQRGLKRIYFGGCFIRGHPITMNTLSYAINFWSKGQVKALFLRHEGYLGATGAFLKHKPIRKARHSFSFSENFTVTEKIAGDSLNAYGILERTPSKLTAFPLLDNLSTYHPDTFELTQPESQNYWIDRLESNLNDIVELATDRAGNDEDVAVDTHDKTTLAADDDHNVLSRLHTFSQLYKSHLEALRAQPNMYGALTVRSLLNLREQCLHEIGFPDIFAKVKKMENEAALMVLSDLLGHCDVMQGPRQQLGFLLENVLAGNMFDWGSNEVMKLLKAGELDFQTAKSKINLQTRSLNNMPDVLDRLTTGRIYKKAVIFVDNSGADIILGVIPFARWLLHRGSSVILAANSFPAVNDVTARELVEILNRISAQDQIIRDAWQSGNLKVIGTGSASPCLDLRRINAELASASKDVDLVVLEGMGRAIHTNLYAKFECDSLKIGVFKSAAVAKELGADLYDALVLYTPGTSNP
ncbi:hypothetical protein BZG36_03434 [Bifiguratus adelaidae]|uniref:Damage-control phosphatase ARMT1-like metal-binding domain-containing protein n=1 Tax=Bifiguratus adelaidae TaxID=1938954 RepID=A0A261XXY4_9FUNG|nr:hypothetical protein BZG36_03434 [Bifiguratus adelaidae]